MEGFERPRPADPGADGEGDAGLSLEELEAEAGEALPDRQAMSLIDASVTIPANPSLAADVLADTLEEALTDDGPDQPPEEPTG